MSILPSIAMYSGNVTLSCHWKIPLPIQKQVVWIATDKNEEVFVSIGNETLSNSSRMLSASDLMIEFDDSSNYLVEHKIRLINISAEDSGVYQCVVNVTPGYPYYSHSKLLQVVGKYCVYRYLCCHPNSGSTRVVFEGSTFAFHNCHSTPTLSNFQNYFLAHFQ